MDGNMIARTRVAWALVSAHSDTVVMALLYGGYGLSLIFESERWYRTPAYANLLETVPANAWGLAYLFVATLLLLATFRWPHSGQLRVVTLGIALTLTVAWLLAFLIRYRTSNNTTPFTVGTNCVYVYLLLRERTVLHRRP